MKTIKRSLEFALFSSVPAIVMYIVYNSTSIGTHKSLLVKEEVKDLQKSHAKARLF